MLTGLSRLGAGALVLALLAGCGGDGDDKADAKKSAKPTPAETTSAAPSYLEAPEGVTLTEPGAALALGEPAVIAFVPRQEQVATLAVTVKRIERTSFQASFPGFKVNDVTAARTPFFVRLNVKNVGDADLGGLQLTNVIWADDGTTLEAPNYYTRAQLRVCSGGALPAKFLKGASVDLCQVYYIAPAQTLKTITFTPPEGVARITWSGTFSKALTPAKLAQQEKAAREAAAKKKAAEKRAAAKKKAAEKKAAEKKKP